MRGIGRVYRGSEKERRIREWTLKAARDYRPELNDEMHACLGGRAAGTQPAARAQEGPTPAQPESRITVASYYFGNYHPGDPRNVKTKGPDWSEWELMKAAKPRFPGHHQPNVPLWGYTDESDPKVMEEKIAAAADHGIDAFIFDWYCYDDGPFLDRAY